MSQSNTPTAVQEEIAAELKRSSADIRDVIVADEKYIIFSWHEQLRPSTLEVLAKNDLTVYPQARAMVTYRHPDIKNERDQPFKATFTAESGGLDL